MKSFKDICLGLIKAEIVVSAICGVYLYGKANYYKGKIDASNEIRNDIEKIREEFEKENGL